MLATRIDDEWVRIRMTLDPDAEANVRRLMNERVLTFEQAVNEAICGGAQRPVGQRRLFRAPTHGMGEPAVPIDHALRLAADLDEGPATTGGG